MSKSKSFTLIELLVVIAIIGILSGLIIVFMSGATNSAKDAKMKEDLEQLNKALAMYNAANASYPSTSGTSCNIGDPSATGACLSLNNIPIPAYYSIIPTNPNTGSYYTYSSASGTDYTLSGVLSSTYAYQYSPSSGYTTAGPVPGACGTANKTYSYGSSSYGSDTFCSIGTASPTSPAFPSAGNSASWTCSGVNGGTTTNCSASRAVYVSTCISGGGLTCTETTSGSYIIDTYTLSGSATGSTTWTTPSGVSSVQYLVVGGGGGGGSNWSGGGGAGGLRGSYDVTGGGGTLESPLAVSGTVNVTVGKGGAGGASGAAHYGSNGDSSALGTITSAGGGGGSNTSSFNGLSGGSGRGRRVYSIIDGNRRERHNRSRFCRG